MTLPKGTPVKISMKSAATVVVAAAVGSALLVAAGPSASAAGTLTFTPASGTKDSLIRVATSGGCPVGSGAFTISITGGAFGATEYNVNGYSPLSSAGTTPGAATGFGVDFSATIASVAQDNSVTLAAGTYSVKLTCLSDDPINPAPLSDFTGTMVFTSASAYVTSAPVRVVSPTIGGVARVGQTLTCAPGTWTGATGYTYQFLKNGVVAQTSTSKRTLVLAAADLNKLVSCRVTAKNAVGSATPVTTRALKVGLGYAPKATTRAKIVYSGTPTAGKTFTASRGVWSPKATYSYVYIWKRGTTIVKSGATATSYRTTAKDKGKVITLTVQAKRTGYTTGTSTSLGVKVR